MKGGTSTAPTYRGLARKGLIRKDYLNGENGTGGVYLWDSRESAEAWFTEERIAELTKRFSANSLFKAAYTWSHAMDDSTAEMSSTVLTPRRPQDFDNPFLSPAYYATSGGTTGAGTRVAIDLDHMFEIGSQSGGLNRAAARLGHARDGVHRHP